MSEVPLYLEGGLGASNSCIHHILCIDHNLCIAHNFPNSGFGYLEGGLGASGSREGVGVASRVDRHHEIRQVLPARDGKVSGSYIFVMYVISLDL